MDNLHELLLQIHKLAEGDKNPQSVSEVQIFVASYHPKPTWQCAVKFRDAHRPWAVAIEDNPGSALTKALYLAQRGDKARQVESRARFYPSRDGAQAHAELLEMEYEEQIRQATVEFEPYKGWVVVLFPKETSFGFFANLEVHAEVREEVMSASSKDRSPAPRREPSTVQVRPRQDGSATPPKVAPAEGRGSLTKDKLEAEYKSIFGKFPDRNIKKADLAKLLDEHETNQSDEDLL